MSPSRVFVPILATALALLGSCGSGSDEVDGLTETVIASGSLDRLAVINGEQAVEAPVIRDCLADGDGECEERSARLPTIEVAPGDTLELITGAESGGVYAILNDTGDGHQSAVAVAGDRRRYTLEIPENVPIGEEISIGVGSTSTHGGSLLFGIATG